MPDAAPLMSEKYAYHFMEINEGYQESLSKQQSLDRRH